MVGPTVNKLPRRAQLYLASVYLLGGALLYHAVGPLPDSTASYLTFAVLAAVAGIAQARPVLDHAKTAYQLAPALLLAGALLLDEPLRSALAVVAFLPEWLVRRPRAHVQLFNIAAAIIQVAAARQAYDLTLALAAGLPFSALLAGGAAGALFLIVNYLLVGLAIWLASRAGPRDAAQLDPRLLPFEGGLLAFGVVLAALWRLDPWLLPFGLAPLFLVEGALQAPLLEAEARTDPKTGLPNARRFAEVYRVELERARRFQHPLAVLVADLDLLREINNRYGHLAGDAVIQGVAQVFLTELRASDLAARFGGEEFVILLPETSGEEALLVAERLRQAIEDEEFWAATVPEPLRATVSIGVAAFPNHGDDPDAVLHAADLAAYWVKLNGRNGVRLAGPDTAALAGRIPLGERRSPLLTTAQPVPSVARSGDQPSAGLAGSPAGPRSRWGALAPAPAAPTAAPPWRLPLFVAALWLAVVLAFALQPRALVAGVTLAGPLLFALLAVFTELFRLDLYGRGANLSISMVVILASGLLFGPIGPLLSAPAAALTVAVANRARPLRFLTTQAVLLLAGWLGAAAFRVLDAPLTWGPHWAALAVGGALAGLTYFAVNTGLIALAMGLVEQLNPPAIWRERYAWLLPHSLVLGLLALAIALAYSAHGPAGLAVFAAPALMMRFVFKQYLDRTAASVEKLREALELTRSAYDSTLAALVVALDARHHETEDHTRRVAELTVALGRALGLRGDELADLRLGALLHDVGTIGVSDTILQKTTRLTEDEWRELRRHPEIGARIVARVPFLTRARDIIAQHHERWDGTGYPYGLAGEQITLGARIFAVADAFDAMTRDRPHRQALSLAEARAELLAGRGTQFDPRVVDAFLGLLDRGELGLGAPSRVARRAGWSLQQADVRS